jgi:phenylalanine-4-hydroxylase
MRPQQQVYANYTPEDFLVWKTLFNRQMQVLEQHAAHDYLDALKSIHFVADKIPDFEEVNALIAKKTGWGLVTVPHISPQKEFFEFLFQKRFTATCWLRSMAQLDYLEEPDMFHDVFGHVPLLTNENYCAFFQEMGRIGLEHLDNPEIILRIGRLYWFTVEFGLIREGNELKLFGAGIMSSKKETEHALSKNSNKIAFSVREVLNTDYRTDIIQDKYFVIDNFKQLSDSVDEIKAELLKLL